MPSEMVINGRYKMGVKYLS